MRPYSQDLRERVVKAVDQGLSRAEIVKLFGVSSATIKRYLKLRRETGNVAPKAIPGYPPRKIGALQRGLQPQLKAHPDATLEEHCRLWEAETGVKVSISTMSDAIQRLRWTRKKKALEASERGFRRIGTKSRNRQLAQKGYGEIFAVARRGSAKRMFGSRSKNRRTTKTKHIHRSLRFYAVKRIDIFAQLE